LIVSKKHFTDKQTMVKYFDSKDGKIELFNIIFEALSTGIKGDFESIDLLIIECDDAEWTLRCYKNGYNSALKTLLRWLEKKELYEECSKVSKLIKKSKN